MPLIDLRLRGMPMPDHFLGRVRLTLFRNKNTWSDD